MSLTDIIIQNIIGGTVFTAVSLTISYFTIKFLIRKVMSEVTSADQKKKFALWIRDMVADNLDYWLSDKKIRKVILEILDIVKERIEAAK
jgi:hypothetical protein